MDAGIKTLAMSSISNNGLHNYSLPKTGGSIDTESRWLPYGAPFALDKADRWLAVYSPLYLYAGSLLWKVSGEAGVRLLSVIGSILSCLVLMGIWKEINTPFEEESRRGLIDYAAPAMAIIATPMLFYTFVIWEHTLFVFVAVSALWLRLNDRIPAGSFFAGILAASGIALRPEGLLWALAMMIIGKKRSVSFIAGLLPGVFLVALLQLYTNGTMIPLQWTENAALFQNNLNGLMQRVIISVGRSDFGYGAALTIVLGILIVLSLRGKPIISNISIVTTLILLFGFIIYRLIVPTPPGLFARSSGWLATAPFAAIWFIMPVHNHKERQIRRVVAVFAIIAIFLNPVPDGIHHGPRVLLIAITLSMLGSFAVFKRTNGTVRLFLLGLLFISLINQFVSIPVIQQTRNDNFRMRELIRERVADAPLLISGWYFGGDLGTDLENRIVLLPGSGSGWLAVLNSMEDEGIEDFWHLRPLDWDGPEKLRPELIKSVGETYSGDDWEIVRYKLLSSIPDKNTSLLLNPPSVYGDSG